MMGWSKSRWTAGLLAAWGLAGTLAAAGVDLRLGAGGDSQLAGLAATVDLGRRAAWTLEGNLDFNTVTHTASPSETTLAGLKLDWNGTPAWNGAVGIDGSTDTRDAVSMGGLSLGATWTWRRRGHAADEDPDAGKRLSLGLELGLHGYRVDLGGNTQLATESGKTLPINAKGQLSLTQFAPTLSLEVPLFGGALVPSLAYTHYAYSQDPTLVADAVEQAILLGPGAGRVQTLVTQLYLQAWSLGLDLPLPWGLGLDLSWGRQQLASSDDWIDSPAATLNAAFGEHWSAHLTWSASLDQGAATSQGEIGVGVRW